MSAVAEAYEFAGTHALREDVDYRWVVDHAKAHYERAVTSARILDDKAAGVINYLGAMTGVAAVVAVSQMPAKPWWLPLALVPVVVFASGAMVCAVRVRRTVGMPLPPDVPSAVKYAEECGPTAEADFALYYGVACREVQELAETKGWWLDWALRLFVGAIIALLVPIIALCLAA